MGRSRRPRSRVRKRRCTDRRGRWAAVWLLCGLLAPLGWAGEAPPRAGPTAAELWSSGPLRWLLLPAESDSLLKVRSHRELTAFWEAFWQRRDPTPGTPENAFATRFFDRVAAADQLYPEPGVRGVATARGRTLILLGSPAGIRVYYREVPVLDPSRERSATSLGRPTRRVEIHRWEYRVQDLPAPLQARLRDGGSTEEEVWVEFVAGESGMRLVEGERLLRMARDAAVRED